VLVRVPVRVRVITPNVLTAVGFVCGCACGVLKACVLFSYRRAPGMLVWWRMRPEDMRIYHVMRELAKEVDRILAVLPPRCRKIADHLDRACESAGLNLNEGLAAFKPRVKAAAFDISRRETSEVRKALQRAVDKKGIHQHGVTKADELANCAIGMLTS
jgi:four helix bundle protein